MRQVNEPSHSKWYIMFKFMFCRSMRQVRPSQLQMAYHVQSFSSTIQWDKLSCYLIQSGKSILSWPSIIQWDKLIWYVVQTGMRTCIPNFSQAWYWDNFLSKVTGTWVFYLWITVLLLLKDNFNPSIKRWVLPKFYQCLKLLCSYAILILLRLAKIDRMSKDLVKDSFHHLWAKRDSCWHPILTKYFQNKSF